jgi:hypothetical protein
VLHGDHVLVDVGPGSALTFAVTREGERAAA